MELDISDLCSQSLEARLVQSLLAGRPGLRTFKRVEQTTAQKRLDNLSHNCQHESDV